MLTDNEILKVIDKVTGSEPTIHDFDVALCEAQEAKTLKAVAKWLEKNRFTNVPHGRLSYDATPKDLEAFSEGRWPE